MSDALRLSTRREIKARAESPGGWGRVASADMVRYVAKAPNRRRKCRQCPEGDHRTTHLGMANGMALMGGCEWSVWQWVKGVDD